MVMVIKGILIEQASPLSLEELAQAIHVHHDIIVEMVDYHLLNPKGQSPETWQFDDVNFKRAKIAASFHRDLEVNLQGIALALDLLDKIDRLEQRLATLERFEEE